MGSISVHDRALAYGDGVFETLRVQRLRPVLIDLHRQRLELGLRRLQITLPIAKIDGFITLFLSRIERHGACDGVLKVIVSRGVGGRGFSPPVPAKPMAYLSWSPLPEHPAQHYDRGIELHWCKQPLACRPWLAGMKHLNCLEYVMAKMELADTNCDDALLCDVDGHLIETTCANLFVVRDDVLLTPVLDRCGIAGTMRQWIMLASSPQRWSEVKEVELREADLAGVDEVFVCNSVFGVKPVRRLGRFCWPVGPLTRAVQCQVEKLLENGT